MDVRIYVDCDEDTRFMRRLARDTHPTKGRGRTVAQVYDAWARNVKPNHHRFVEPTKRFAHVILPHHGVFADPGHLLAVGEEGIQTYAAETGAPSEEAAVVDEVTCLDSCALAKSTRRGWLLLRDASHTLHNTARSRLIV